MKKIVSIIFTLFVLVSNVNAQSYTFAEQFKTISGTVKARGFEEQSLYLKFESNYSANAGRTKGITITERGYLKLSAKSTGTTITVSISLTGHAKDCSFNDGNTTKRLVIKRITFNCADQNCFAGSTVMSEDNGVFVNNNKLTFSPKGNSCVLNNDYSDVQSIQITNTITSPVTIVSVDIDYGFIYDNYELVDGQAYPFSSEYIYVKNLTYKRSMSTRKGTLCLPFDYKTSDTNGYIYLLDNILNDKLQTYDPDGSYVIKASRPTIFTCYSDEFVVRAKDVLLTDEGYDKVTGRSKNTKSIDQSVDFYGVIKNDVASTGGLFISKDKFYEVPANTKVNIKTYRAWIAPKTAEAKSRLRDMFNEAFGTNDDFECFESGETTAVSSVNTESESSEIYGIDGTKNSSLKKGLNLVKTANGVKKVFVR